MTDGAGGLLKRFRVHAGHLHAGGLDVVELAGTHGTPLYIYDLGIIRERYSNLRALLPPEVDVYFAVKANPSVAVCTLLRGLGAGAEVVSEGELLVAQAAGFAPERIFVNGPGKPPALLEAAIDAQVAFINVESSTDFRRIEEAATRRGQQTNVFLRINPAYVSVGAGIPTGGGPQKFGVDEDSAGELIETMLRSRAVNLCGIHVFVGSQVMEYRRALAVARKTIELAASYAGRYHFPLRIVNFGGGFGVPYGQDDREFDVKSYCRELSAMLDSLDAAHPARGARFVLELGRFLAAEAGVYVTRVLDVKESHGKRFVITDGGINHAMLPITTNRYPVLLVNKMDDASRAPCYVGGPLCTSADLSPAEIALPGAAPGDLVGFFGSGAYGYSASLLSFLSFPAPAEIVVEHGRSIVARERGFATDFLSNQHCWEESR